MNFSSIGSLPLVLLSLRLILIAWALVMLRLTELPLSSTVLAGAVGLCSLLPDLSPRSYRERIWKLAVASAWFASLLLPICLSLEARRLTFFHVYYAMVAWLIALSLALTVRSVTQQPARQFWKVLVMVWAFLGEFIWISEAYLENREWDFYLGLVLIVILLALTKFWFRPPGFAILTANTLILTLVLLPLADLLTRPPKHLDLQPNVAGDGYLYEVAARDPQAFSIYWNRYHAQYARLMKEMSYPDPEQKLPYRVRTNIQTSFFQSHIPINSRGYRGKEISSDKGNAYRIIALGESNTFGFTLDPEHKPWPEFLEEMIRERAQFKRPIEIINTGLPNHSLEDNLNRLRTDILALKPDMIISYHGWNGFPWLYSSLPPVFVKHLPHYKNRPLWLLAVCEYRVKLLRFKRSLKANPVVEIPPVSKLLETRYGIAYEQLAALTRTNGIRLVLADYTMAVNSQSEPKVIEFYREAFPAVYPSIQVNVMHSVLLKEIARRHPEICLVDTHPNLDGDHRKFIDLVHFAPKGDLQLAETIYTAVTNILKQELTGPKEQPTW